MFVNPSNQNGKDYDYIKSYKLKTSAKEFCKSEKSKILIPLLEEAYSYSYDEKPNYGKLKFMLQSIMLEKGYVPDSLFSWVYLPG